MKTSRKMFLTVLAFISILTVEAPAQGIAAGNGFNVTVECDAHPINGGHPANATKIQLGYFKNPLGGISESLFYILSGTQVGVALKSTQVFVSSQVLRANLYSWDSDTSSNVNYGILEIQFDYTGKGKGFMKSAYENTEPYVLGSLSLDNCYEKRR